MSHLCECLLPSFERYATGAFPGEEVEIRCILPDDDCIGLHVGVRPDDRYVVWTFYTEESCECEPEECECFNYEIFESFEEVEDYLKDADEFEIDL